MKLHDLVEETAREGKIRAARYPDWVDDPRKPDFTQAVADHRLACKRALYLLTNALAARPELLEHLAGEGNGDAFLAQIERPML